MRRYIIILAIILVALSLPLWVGSLPLTVLVFAGIASIAALGFNITFGMAGQLSMFHAAAFGVGGYATLLTMRHGELGYLPSVMLACLLVAVLASVIGFLCFRFKLREFYFAVTTFAFSEIVRLVVLNWHDLTNGSLGITITEKPVIGIFGYEILKVVSLDTWFYTVLFLLLAVLVIYQAISHSWIGNALAAVRLNDDLSDTLGIDSFRYKLLGFVIGAVVAAFAGSLYVFFIGFVDPAIMSIDQMLLIVAMVLFGGTRSAAGPVFGAVVLTALPHLIDLSAELRNIAYGGILIAVILLMPQGITGFITDQFRRVTRA